MSEWEHHQDFERKWWGHCGNTYGEETKQIVYAKLMGLAFSHDGNSPFSINMTGKSVMDIGGGPSSLLLKCHLDHGVVVDPCEYPEWVAKRYEAAGIGFIRQAGEDIPDDARAEYFDEVWIYNVLQHTQDPERIIKNAMRCGKVLRIFEWIDIPAHEGHPHMLTEANLNAWIGQAGSTGVLTGEGECFGRYYAGVFHHG